MRRQTGLQLASRMWGRSTQSVKRKPVIRVPRASAPFGDHLLRTKSGFADPVSQATSVPPLAIGNYRNEAGPSFFKRHKSAGQEKWSCPDTTEHAIKSNAIAAIRDRNPQIAEWSAGRSVIDETSDTEGPVLFQLNHSNPPSLIPRAAAMIDTKVTTDFAVASAIYA